MTVTKHMWVTYYKYYFEGKYYCSDCRGIPVTCEKPSLGDYQEIAINPNNPEEYWYNSEENSGMIARFVIGAIFVVVGVIIFPVLQNLLQTSEMVLV